MNTRELYSRLINQHYKHLHMKNYINWSCLDDLTPYLLTISFVYQIEGYVSLMTVRYCLFKSRPVKEHLLFPTITPSGFSIGTILNMNFSRSSFAVLDSPVRKSRTPFIIQEAGVSPGWTRAVTTTALFF